AEAKKKVYVDADAAVRRSKGALVNGDADAVFSGALSRDAGEDVGSYAITQGDLSAGGNYSIVYVGADLSITKRAVTITADAKSKVYGDADPALSYSHGALLNGDTDSVFSGALSRDAGEDVGSYAITQGDLSAGGNYSIVYVGADLSITKRDLTVTADAKSKVYGDADPALSYSHGALVNGDTDSVFSGALS